MICLRVTMFLGFDHYSQFEGRQNPEQQTGLRPCTRCKGFSAELEQERATLLYRGRPHFWRSAWDRASPLISKCFQETKIDRASSRPSRTVEMTINGIPDARDVLIPWSFLKIRLGQDFAFDFLVCFSVKNDWQGCLGTLENSKIEHVIVIWGP